MALNKFNISESETFTSTEFDGIIEAVKIGQFRFSTIHHLGETGTMKSKMLSLLGLLAIANCLFSIEMSVTIQNKGTTSMKVSKNLQHLQQQPTCKDENGTIIPCTHFRNR